MTSDDILALIQKQFPDLGAMILEGTECLTLRVPREQLAPLCEFLHSSPFTTFDYLANLTAVDNMDWLEYSNLLGPKNTIEVVYTMVSSYDKHMLSLHVTLPRDNPEIPSVSSIWPTAEWHEREVYDLYGVVFTNHPDLRRIMMPDDWVGYPMRRDYTHENLIPKPAPEGVYMVKKAK
ncbi:MAG: NADH-quinone oxidoreductase subunit C [Armatimonadetes bacterium]|nr:NADH-quinone oxidoreductase subunit C [Armatimonadota bacterium]